MKHIFPGAVGNITSSTTHNGSTIVAVNEYRVEYVDSGGNHRVVTPSGFVPTGITSPPAAKFKVGATINTGGPAITVESIDGPWIEGTDANGDAFVARSLHFSYTVT